MAQEYETISGFARPRQVVDDDVLAIATFLCDIIETSL